MSEYIKKSDVRHLLLHNDREAAIAQLDELESVDAVPVVRCRDCLWRHDDSSPAWLPCMERETPNDWFCADGERRSDGEQ